MKASFVSTLTPRAIDASGVVCLLALSLLAYFGVVVQVKASVSVAHDAKVEQSLLESKLLAAANNAEAATRQLESIKAEAASAFNLFHLQAMNQRLGALTAEAERAGLTIVQLKPGDAKDVGGVVEVPVVVSGHADYRTFTAFIESLRPSFADFAIVSCQISAPIAAQSFGNASADLPAFSFHAIWHAQRGPAAKSKSPALPTQNEQASQNSAATPRP